MSGIKPSRQVQLGKQASTSATACTSIWHGNGLLDDTRVQKMIDADVGIMSGVDDTYETALEAGMLFEATPATFEQLPHLCEMTISKITTASQDGSGSGYIRQYTWPTTTVPTLRPYTVKTGDNEQAEVADYVHGTDITLTGDERQSWTMACNAIGRQVQASTFNTTATLPSVEVMLFQKTKLYIDSITGTYGTTQVSNTLLAAQVVYNNGGRAKYTADGEKYFSFFQPTKPAVTGKMTFEHNSSATTQKAGWRTMTPYKVRLKCEGSTFTTAGTAYSKKTMIIDMSIRWTKFAKIGERNGNNVIEGTFTSRYNRTSADFGKLVIVNALSTLG